MSLLMLEELSGKRLALYGFDTPEADVVSSVLDLAGAFCRSIPGVPGTPLEPLASSFDGAIVHLGPTIDLKLLAASGKPILVAAPHAVLAERLGSIRTYAADSVGYPCSAEELLLRVYSSIAFRAPAEAPSSGPPVVLIADDDPSIRTLVRATLGNKEVECRMAEDGEAALRMAREIRPAVLVLDVNMPQIDGFEVLSTLKSESATASLRVLMLTGCEQETDVVRAFGLGADDYLVKPFNPMELSVRVRRLIGAYR